MVQICIIMETTDKLHQHPILIVDEETNIEIEVMDKNCFLLHGALDKEEQTRLFEYILEKDKTPEKPSTAIFPSPKTLILGDDSPLLKFEFGEKSLVNTTVDNVSEIVMRNKLNKNVDLCKYKSIGMGVIKYLSPKGHFPAHIDHCNYSFVYLTSLGCTANFLVKTPSMETKRIFKFNSGDLLVFDASTEAAVLHEVVSIDDGTSCPDELGNAFDVMKTHRFGVQCRVHF